MRLYQFDDNEEQFSLLRIAEVVNFTEGPFDRLASLNVGESLEVEDESPDFSLETEQFKITRIQ